MFHDLPDYPSCVGEDPELFYPEGRPESYTHQLQVAVAKAVCDGCPIREQCLEDNLEVEFGIYGGKTAQERRAIREAAGIPRWPSWVDLNRETISIRGRDTLAA